MQRGESLGDATNCLSPTRTAWEIAGLHCTVVRSVGELQMVANNCVILGSACIQSCNVCIDIEVSMSMNVCQV